MKSAIFFAQYNLSGADVYTCYDYVHLGNLSDISVGLDNAATSWILVNKQLLI